MHKLSSDFINDYSGFMVGRGMDLAWQVDDKNLAVLSSGPVSDNPESWGWALKLIGSEGRETIAGAVHWGDNDWQRYGGNYQGVLWRPTYKLNDEKLTAVAHTTGRTIGWHYVGRGMREGDPVKHGIVDDPDELLSQFVGRAVEMSDIKQRVEDIKAARTKTTKIRQIGFLGVGGVDARHNRPSLFVHSLPLKEKTIRIANMSKLVQSILQDEQPAFKAWVRLKISEG